ncbi:G patch domain-containing protein 1-like [Symsagittifera roscoffensis]|uniref:G patch domain-containing protein 1-like n=1 Tax=Symsagittifera roscoffensis TaxID=84072 RepID=UPI00307CB27C
MFKNRDVQNEEDNDLCVHYGTPFAPLDEDEQPIRKPVPIHEQVVTDDRGRQRFHGAFTGGFSAGFFNTVGSKEGFEPQTFQSSRSSRQSFKQKDVNDFMDEEDINEFGIAPKRLKVNEDFVNEKSAGQVNKKLDLIERHIQANPVDLGIRLLRRLGIRDGKGVGANVERALSIAQGSNDSNEELECGKVYTCARPPPEFELLAEPDSIEPDMMRKFRLAPDDVSAFVVDSHKNDRKGLGYTGLNPEVFVGRKGNNFVSRTVTGMSGQAFGVGAFEDEDDDVYAHENMSEYDFEIGPARLKDKREANKIGLGVTEGFLKAKKSFEMKQVKAPKLPPNYKPSVPKSVLSLAEKDSSKDLELSKPLVFAGVRTKQGLIEPVTSKSANPFSSNKVGKAVLNISDTTENAIHNFANGSNDSKLEWSENSAEKQFKPSILPTNSRFVSAGKLDTLSNRVIEHEHIETPREKAARMKMFGPLTRSVMPFRFAPVVCKRFNVKTTAENSYEPKLQENSVKSMFNGGSSNNSASVIELAVGVNNTQKDKSLANRSASKSNFLAFLNDEPQSQNYGQKTSSSSSTENAMRNKQVTENNELSSKVNHNNEEKSANETYANSEEVLDSLKNVNLLLDVFGDDDEDDGDDDNNPSDYDPKNAENVLSSTFLKSKSVSNELIGGHSSEDFDSFSKFFKVPENISTIQSSHNSSTLPENCKMKEGSEQQESVESDDEFGPSLPPILPVVFSSDKSEISQENPKTELNVLESLQSSSLSLELVEKTREQLKHKKKNKEKRHKKSSKR